MYVRNGCKITRFSKAASKFKFIECNFYCLLRLNLLCNFSMKFGYPVTDAHLQSESTVLNLMNFLTV